MFRKLLRTKELFLIYCLFDQENFVDTSGSKRIELDKEMVTGIMKARKVIEKAPEKSRNIAKLGTLIEIKPVKSTIKQR